MTASLLAPPRSTPEVTPTRRTTRTPRTSQSRPRSAAVQRAYARRAHRMNALHRSRLNPANVNRVPFVVLIMVLLTAALVATLWLSTAATGDSYRLQEARESTRMLAERSEQLGREVAVLETAPELARRALELGMVPARDPARLVVRADGRIAVVGEPTPAQSPDSSVAEQPPSTRSAALQPSSVVAGTAPPRAEHGTR